MGFQLASGCRRWRAESRPPRLDPLSVRASARWSHLDTASYRPQQLPTG
jgi:hypothetical protein